MTVFLENPGYCPTCECQVTFVARSSWLRDHYVCSNCGSVPRERALMRAIEMYFPNWKDLVVHESSPAKRGASVRLARQCKNYIPSQFFPREKRGSTVDGVRCEDLEALTFGDETIDLHVTQDVMEHVFAPSKVFREIARTLKPGGAHIFTVPLVNRNNPSKLRARRRDDGYLDYLQPPEYHHNPISDQGALVTVDWGFDICTHIFDSCGLFTHLLYIEDLSKGIKADYNEVLITLKPSSVSRGDAIP
jgi:SAM-dependent methyltransferase